MTICAVWNFDGASMDQYEKVFEMGGDVINDQPERLSHVCYERPGGITVVDVWRGEDAFAAFGAVLGPAVQAAGLTEPPSVFLVQGFMDASGVRNP